MQLNLPLSKMTREEKLVVIDRIWDDLIKNQDDIPSPDWHREVLLAREIRVKKGEAVYKEWKEAKSNLHDEFK